MINNESSVTKPIDKKQSMLSPSNQYEEYYKSIFSVHLSPSKTAKQVLVDL